MSVRVVNCANRKGRCLETSEAQIHPHLFLEGNMPEISKGHPVSNASFDNTDESKVTSDRYSDHSDLIRQIGFLVAFAIKSLFPAHEGWLFSSCSYCGAPHSFPDCI